MPVNQKSWTPKEDQYLRENYPAQTHKQLAITLERSESCVRQRCYRLQNPVKLYSPEDDKFILENFSTMTHKDMGKALGRSTESLRSRCRTLDLKKPAHMVVASIKTGQKQPDGLDLSTIPAFLQKWFGFSMVEIPKAAKPYLRHIEEKMPEFTVSKSRTHIGSGTQFMISELANL